MRIDTPGWQEQGKRVVQAELIPVLVGSLSDLILEYQKEVRAGTAPAAHDLAGGESTRLAGVLVAL